MRMLRYFLAVAEELNFTRAAERLHIAQPSLSAQIRQLEAQLGVALLQRSTRSVSLTEAGHVLLAQGPRALAGMERAWSAAREAGRGTAGTVRLAYSLSAGHETAPDLIEAMRVAHPRISVTTAVLPTPQVLLAVRDGDADIGLARAPAPLEGVRLERLRNDLAGVLVAADHPLAEAASVELRAVAEHPVVLHPRAANPTHYDFIQGLFTSRNLHPHFIERDIAFDLSQRLVAAGSAVAVVGRSAIARLSPDLTWIPLCESVTIPVALALPATDQSATSAHFERVAMAHAADHHWLK